MKNSNQNKNQTAIERARLKAISGLEYSKHYCASEKCPNADLPILKKDLQPVMVFSPKKKMAFYHSSCYNSR